LDINKAGKHYHIRISAWTLIASIASMFLSIALASAVVSRSAIMEAARANVENREALRLAKEETRRIVEDIARTCPVRDERAMR
jgi:hypothetical protein